VKGYFYTIYTDIENEDNRMIKKFNIEHEAKFGSNLVTCSDGIDYSAIESYATGFVESGQAEEGLIIVTSGAVVAGEVSARLTMEEERVSKLTLKQKSALGSVAVFAAWESAFRGLGVEAASFAVTHHQLLCDKRRHNLRNRKEKINFRNLVISNAREGIVTVTNEADHFSNVELMKLRFGGDNDGLASHIARGIGVRSLTIFAKMGGIFDENGELITVVDDDNIRQVRKIAATRDVSATGRGGLLTKIDACRSAAKAGIFTRIASTSSDMSGINATEFVVG
jgi:glutamate 5-kinase